MAPKDVTNQGSATPSDAAPSAEETQQGAQGAHAPRVTEAAATPIAPSENGAGADFLDGQLHGWEIYPPDELGVRRTGIRLGQLRVWIVPREHLSQVTKSELGGGVTHPGLYALVDGPAKKIYVGESHDLQNRLGGHAKLPPKELGTFQTAVILNDGRNSAHSVYNEHTLRQAIEQSMVSLITTTLAESPFAL